MFTRLFSASHVCDLRARERSSSSLTPIDACTLATNKDSPTGRVRSDLADATVCGRCSVSGPDRISVDACSTDDEQGQPAHGGQVGYGLVWPTRPAEVMEAITMEAIL